MIAHIRKELDEALADGAYELAGAIVKANPDLGVSIQWCCDGSAELINEEEVE